MLSKDFFRILAASALLLGTSAFAQAQMTEEGYRHAPLLGAPRAASAPEVTHDYDWYAAKTYTWTDASGVSHTASLVDEVTNPYQMYDLFRWVYCNPEIPGNKWDAVTNSATYYGEIYDLESYGWGGTRHVDPGWNIYDSDVTAPYEDGHTLFLIKLKNYSTPASGAKHTTTKAELVNEFSTCIQSVKLITDAMRVGEGDNTGSIVNIEGEFNRFFIIGKGKSYYWEPTTSNNNPPYAPFYNMFEEYSPTTTEVGDEITDFYEKMTQGEIYPVVHDCSTVINFEHYFSMSGKNGTQEKSLTGMFLYIPDNRNSYDERNYNENHQPTTGIYVIELGGKAQDNGDRTYTVTLDWTSKLDEAVGSTVPQNYTLYVYVTDETGNTRVELVNTTETTYSYVVPQDEHSYTITYVVYGEAIANENFNTWSNDATVVIPGWNDFISLTLNHYESDFVKNDGNNYYRNFMGIINDVNAITPENIDAGMNQIVVNRFDAATPEALLPVATITFTNNNGRVNYSVAYQEQNILSGYNLNQINVNTSGNLGNYAADAIVDLSPITIVDQFAESVEGNNHPEKYGYVLTLGEKSSNDVEVPVTKVNATIDGYYTKEQVDNDIDLDNMLTPNVKSANVELNLVNNARIYYYTMDRGNNAEPTEQISYLQRRTDGTFMEMNDVLGDAGNWYNEGVHNYFDADPYIGTYGDYLSYLPTVWTFGTERVKGGDNSYGSPVLKTGVGKVDEVGQTTKAINPRFIWQDENGVDCYLYNPIMTIDGIVPDYASVDYEPYMYRVWRLCDDIRGFKKDWNLDEGGYYFYINDEEAPRDARLMIAEERTNESQIVLGDANDALAFGAIDNAKIEYLIRFYYVKKADRGTEENKYYVIEYKAPAKVNTSVNELGAASKVVSTTYINAQGIKSDKPFSGLNIVITRFADGTTQTNKVVR